MHAKPLLEKGLFNKERICSRPIEQIPFQMGQNNFELSPLKVYQFPFNDEA